MSERSRLRLVVLQILVVSLLVTLGGRLYFLQVMAGETYQQAATNNRVREVLTPAVRGQILDSAGRPLVRNRTAMVVSVSRTAILKQPDDGEAVLRRLANVLDQRYSALDKKTRLCAPGVDQPCWNGSPYQPIPVADDVEPQVALQIVERAEDFPGVTAELLPVRDYPGKTAAPHTLGYLSPITEEELEELEARAGSDGKVLQHAALAGRSGLEQQYDTYLRGEPGVQSVAVDHLGRVSGTVGQQAPIPGSHLVTSLDAGIQADAEKRLREGIHRARIGDTFPHQKFKADSGAIVVMDHTNGRVLAMASYPGYDPKVWVGGISQKNYDRLTSQKAGTPLISRATQGEFAPASTFKVISTSAAVKAGYPLHGTYDCSSGFQAGGRWFKNYESAAYGPISFQKALEISCDSIFYRLAYEMWLKDGGLTPVKHPKDPMVTMAKGWGLGKPTGIDLPSESDGRIADREWKREYWEATKDFNCSYARKKHPDPKLERKDPARARFLKQLAYENCLDGYQFRAGDAVNFSIGQGDTTVTPLQQARTYAAVANGGTLWEPRIGKAIVRPDGSVVKRITPQEAGRVPVPKRTLDYIRNALYGVPSVGTAAWRFIGFPLDEHPLAGKTGTGEVYGKQTTSWYVGFDKRYVIAMMVSQGGTGSGTSAPSVRALFEDIYGIGTKPLFENGKPPAGLPPRLPDGTEIHRAAPGDRS
ncbi:MAG: penicillin-binding protein 2 [Actinomycetes bacterium]